jgi:hypothetical protein
VESYKVMKSCGIGSAHMQTMTNFFHNGGVGPRLWVEKDAADLASHPQR